MPTSLVSGITTAVTDVTGGFTAVTGWWVVGVAVAFFGAGIVINLIASFFGKRRKRRGK